MTPPGMRLLLLAAAALACAAPATTAAAQVQGPCAPYLNGVEAERIDSLSSPLLLGDGDTLVFSGTDAGGTFDAEIAVLLGPATIGRAASSSGVAAGEFTVSLDLADGAPSGVGLLRVRATTDNCTVEAWLRLGGRLPFTTLVGLTGTGLAVAGLTGQISALLARRRWSAPVAAAAGVATGAGGALLGQELGRLQLSYLALGGAVALAVLAGLGLALLLRARRGEEGDAPPEEPDYEEGDAGVLATPAASRRPETAPAPAAPAPVRRPEAARPAPSRDEPATPLAPVAQAAPAAQAAPVTPAAPATNPTPAPRPAPAGPFWCYVMTDVEVLHLDDYARVVAVLHPGTWYLAKREVSGWAQVVAADGSEGWVPRQALHREG